MTKKYLAFFIALSLPGSVHAKKLDADALRLCADFQKTVQAGDIVFVEINNNVFRNVSKTQNSWANHVGVVVSVDGQIQVAESTIPLSKITPFCEFIAKGSATTVAALRPRWDVSPAETHELSALAETQLQIPYHTGFDFDNSSRSFCSKFVHEIYKTVTGRSLGQFQTFRQLFSETLFPEVLSFWRQWFLGRIPWERRTLTPASLYHDSNLRPLFFRQSPSRAIDLPNYPDSFGSRDLP